MNSTLSRNINISVCIATYRREDRLKLLLSDLIDQEFQPNEVIVVDNDASGSARATVEQCLASKPSFPIIYGIQPKKNISLTRNCTAALARGDWVAFIDDDERAPRAWLKRLADAVVQYGADGVLGPVEPVVPAEAPTWIRQGRFYDWAHWPSGSIVPVNKLRFGNVILRGNLLRGATAPFNPAYGLTGGEDGDLLGRLQQRGATIVWCDEACVFEPVEKSRLSLRWLLLRALRGGQDFARHKLSGSFGLLTTAGRVLLLFRALAQSLLAAGLAIINWPRGRHHAVHWLLKAAANIGKISIFFGWHYREYGDKRT